MPSVYENKSLKITTKNLKSALTMLLFIMYSYIPVFLIHRFKKDVTKMPYLFNHPTIQVGTTLSGVNAWNVLWVCWRVTFYHQGSPFDHPPEIDKPPFFGTWEGSEQIGLLGDEGDTCRLRPPPPFLFLEPNWGSRGKILVSIVLYVSSEIVFSGTVWSSPRF